MTTEPIILLIKGNLFSDGHICIRKYKVTTKFVLKHDTDVMLSIF